MRFAVRPVEGFWSDGPRQLVSRRTQPLSTRPNCERAFTPVLQRHERAIHAHADWRVANGSMNLAKSSRETIDCAEWRAKHGRTIYELQRGRHGGRGVL